MNITRGSELTGEDNKTFEENSLLKGKYIELQITMEAEMLKQMSKKIKISIIHIN